MNSTEQNKYLLLAELVGVKEKLLPLLERRDSLIGSALREGAGIAELERASGVPRHKIKKSKYSQKGEIQ